MLHPLRRSCVVITLCLCCSSCFTMALWGFELDSRVDPDTGHSTTEAVYDRHTRWSFWRVVGRLLCTPATLCLDVATAPVQKWLFWDDDDDDVCHARPRC
jgi:hypothetical protein